MAAYRLSEDMPDILLIEKGNDLKNRKCSVIERRAGQCVKCPSCAVMEGMAGAGAFSDGKFVISTEYGGWLTDILSEQTVMDYIEQADDILVAHGASTERFFPDSELKTICLRHDLHMQQA
ncbi:MAG TPA: FAD-dependent oxidoreductase, partial [Clostridia bacterium]|nr:FAD-dependent oxidoreductase [Clostridia bacterium]